ncbi:MAG: hypothetical protein P4L49_09030 [Desulfosporosinus sp.]|nr:hypothetical protein [Desulfosporosinus sp.]
MIEEVEENESDKGHPDIAILTLKIAELDAKFVKLQTEVNTLVNKKKLKKMKLRKEKKVKCKCKAE